jgi:replicative superfamily II helicase
LDGQLYDILVAIDSTSATLPNGNQFAEIQNGELVNVEVIDAGQF